MMIDACRNLEVTVAYGVGYNALGHDPCRERNVMETNTPDILTREVADLGVQ